MEKSLENEHEEEVATQIDGDLEMGEVEIVTKCPFSLQTIKMAATAVCKIHYFDYESVVKLLTNKQKRSPNFGLSCPVPGCR